MFQKDFLTKIDHGTPCTPPQPNRLPTLFKAPGSLQIRPIIHHTPLCRKIRTMSRWEPLSRQKPRNVWNILGTTTSSSIRSPEIREFVGWRFRKSGHAIKISWFHEWFHDHFKFGKCSSFPTRNKNLVGKLEVDWTIFDLALKFIPSHPRRVHPSTPFCVKQNFW